MRERLRLAGRPLPPAPPLPPPLSPPLLPPRPPPDARAGGGAGRSAIRPAGEGEEGGGADLRPRPPPAGVRAMSAGRIGAARRSSGSGLSGCASSTGAARGGRDGAERAGSARNSGSRRAAAVRLRGAAVLRDATTAGRSSGERRRSNAESAGGEAGGRLMLAPRIISPSCSPAASRPACVSRPCPLVTMKNTAPPSRNCLIGPFHHQNGAETPACCWPMAHCPRSHRLMPAHAAANSCRGSAQMGDDAGSGG